MFDDAPVPRRKEILLQTDLLQLGFQYNLSLRENKSVTLIISDGSAPLIFEERSPLHASCAAIHSAETNSSDQQRGRESYETLR
jgi:hypothetical protein